MRRRTFAFEQYANTGTVSEREAASAAAWLVNKHRAKFRTYGDVTFYQEMSQPMPRWFEVAIACLAARKGWTVTAVPEPGVVAFKVEWLRARRIRSWKIN